MNAPTLAFFSRVLDDAPPAQRLRFATEQIQHAERFGLHRAWVAQHHFRESEGGLPSPLVFLAHVAALTSEIRLGTGIITLPLEDPIRTAEDATLANVLSGNRIDLGLGSGGTPSSFEPFGQTVREKATVYEEKLARLRHALSGGDIGGGNTLYPAAVALATRLWQATFSTFGGTRAGESGDGLLLSRTQPRPVDAPGAALSEIQHPIIDAYLEALPDGVNPRITASRTVFVADTRAEALRFAEIGVRAGAASLRRQGHQIPDGDIETLIRATDTHIGTPAEVAASLAADTTLGRVQEVAFQVHSVDAPHAQILRSIELFATEVAPALGWARTAPTPVQETA